MFSFFKSNDKEHKHSSFIFNKELPTSLASRLVLGYSIDDAVDRLITENRENKRAITQFQAQLESIHAHYRSELCGDCCHVHVCGIFPKVKYGFECEERTICMIEIESENTADETEPSKEESPCCSKSGDGD